MESDIEGCVIIMLSGQKKSSHPSHLNDLPSRAAPVDGVSEHFVGKYLLPLNI